MALVKVKDILKHATEHKYGVAAINTINVETIKYAILAAGKGAAYRAVLSRL